MQFLKPRVDKSSISLCINVRNNLNEKENPGVSTENTMERIHSVANDCSEEEQKKENRVP